MPAASAGRNVVPLLVSERLAHLFLDVIARLRMILKLCRPGATGMKCIPRRTLLLMSPFSGGMIAEAGDNRIPYRPVHFDEQRLGQRNPDIINNQISTSEVCQIEVLRLFNRESVLSQKSAENPAIHGTQR
jgi:hypothetical protein